jgi:SH3-like domain-containing protein
VVATAVTRVLLPVSQPSYAVPAPSASTFSAPVPTETTSRLSRDRYRAPLSSTPSLSSIEPGDIPGVGAAAMVAQSALPKAAVVASLKIIGVRYTTTGLNVRTQPSVNADLITVLKAGTKVSITSGDKSGWTSILLNGKGRWVHSQYLSTKRPTLAVSSSGGISSAPCASGSAVESGLTPDAIRVHRAICARWPQVKTYYGLRGGGGGYHPSGRALDSMIGDSTVGWQIANWVRANARQLGAMEVIYSQRIWTVQRSSEGWRAMSDRGGRTANHYDHVHVSVYGNSGTS